MIPNARYFELSCPACGWSELCGAEAMTRLLLKARKLKATAEPDLAVIIELFRVVAGSLNCPECGAAGLFAREIAEDDADWPGPRRCEGCRGVIPPQRLEALPDTMLCAACQTKVERGEPIGPTEYCPRCGAPMELRQRRSGGIARYAMSCTAQPPCRGGFRS